MHHAVTIQHYFWGNEGRSEPAIILSRHFNNLVKGILEIKEIVVQPGIWSKKACKLSQVVGTDSLLQRSLIKAEATQWAS